MTQQEMVAWLRECATNCREGAEAYTRDGRIRMLENAGRYDAIADRLEAQHTPVLAEVVAERRRQDEKHGGPAHDDTHTLPKWWGLMMQRMVGRAYPGGRADERKDLVQIAALAVAAVESIDRKTALPKESAALTKKALRGWADGRIVTPMSTLQRVWCIQEIRHCGDATHQPDDFSGYSDMSLASAVLSAWRDFARDKGAM